MQTAKKIHFFTASVLVALGALMIISNIFGDHIPILTMFGFLADILWDIFGLFVIGSMSGASSPFSWIMGIPFIIIGLIYLKIYFRPQTDRRIVIVSSVFSLVGAILLFLVTAFLQIYCLYINRDLGCFIIMVFPGIAGLGSIAIGILLLLGSLLFRK